MANTDRLKISVIMPAYNASHLLDRVLTPLIEMLKAGEVDEVIVVDDQSPDDTADLAGKMGAKVLVTPKNGGPGAARNMAADHAIGDVLWFVDSDVIAAPGGAGHLRRAFAEDSVDAVFGSYDDTPDGRYWFSRYKNLLHRYHHQTARRDASTFWAGCGAVRASSFRRIGGFDVDTYRVPSIEDIELGYRIRSNGGQILVEPELQGKHLKIWTIRNGVFTDIFRRALPWSRLMISREGLTDDLNTSLPERGRALLAIAFLVSVVLLPFVPAYWPVTVLLFLLAILGNWRFVAFLYRNGGLVFALLSIAFHQLYYAYSAAAYGWCLFEYHLLGRKDRLHVP